MSGVFQNIDPHRPVVRGEDTLAGWRVRGGWSICTLHMYVLCVTILIISCYWCSAAMGKLPIPLAGHCVVTVTWNGRNAALGISSVYLIKFISEGRLQ
jgi:hypothetical protein